MDPADDLIAKRFTELDQQMARLRVSPGEAHGEWHQWATSALNLLQRAFREPSSYSHNFQQIYNSFSGFQSDVEAAKGVFRAAKIDYEGGSIN
jgi:hypothetical protein